MLRRFERAILQRSDTKCWVYVPEGPLDVVACTLKGLDTEPTGSYFIESEKYHAVSESEITGQARVSIASAFSDRVVLQTQVSEWPRHSIVTADSW